MKKHSNILEVAALRPYFMGFIFYPKSPRYVGDRFEMPPLPASINKVGVFVNENLEVILGAVKKYQFDFVQLHGDETVGETAELRQSGVGIIKVFRVDASFDFAITTTYHPYVDYFLFDTKGKNYGGNNVAFNWSILCRYDQSTPFLLSGGLNAENLRETSQLEVLNCVGFDLNSGVETQPGIKNIESIQKIIEVLES